MTEVEIARQAVIAIASEDEYWSESDERLVNVEPAAGPGRFTFTVAGTFHTDRGCIKVDDGKADVWYHDEDTMKRCEICGWESDL